MANTKQYSADGISLNLETIPWQSGERMLVGRPKNWKADGTIPAVIYCPALGGGAGNMLGWFLWPDIIRRGMPIICADLGTTPSPDWITPNGTPLFGNDTAESRLTDLIEWVTTAPTVNTSKGIPGFGAFPSKIILHGGSMGGQTATVYAHDYPTKIDSVFVDIPAFDPEWSRIANPTTTYYPGGLSAPIVAALGGPPVPDNKRGALLINTWPLAVPYYGWYEGSDIFTGESVYDQFKIDFAARGVTGSFIKSGNIGHNTTNFPWTTVADMTEARAIALMG